MRNVLNSINMLGFISAQPKKLSSSNCQTWQREREKYKNKEDKKRNKGSLLLLPERKVCLHSLKTKTTSSHKIIYIKRNNLGKTGFAYFSQCLSKTLNKVTKNNIHSTNDNIITKKKKKSKKKYYD